MKNKSEECVQQYKYMFKKYRDSMHSEKRIQKRKEEIKKIITRNGSSKVSVDVNPIKYGRKRICLWYFKSGDFIFNNKFCG